MMSRPVRSMRRQSGATLIIALVMLLIIAMFAVSGFNVSTSNLKVVGNQQSRNESLAAAQQAIEATISNNMFATDPTAVAASPIYVDINGDGVTDYTANLVTVPTCYRARAIKTNELDVTKSADVACLASSSLQNSGIITPGSSATAGNSLCAYTEWDIAARVSDTVTAASVVVHQGVTMRVAEADAGNYCK